MITDTLTQTIARWINELGQYTLAELRDKPSPRGWSLGQLYFHLINNTGYYLEEAKLCLSSDDNMHEEPSPDGAAMLDKNEFPDIIIEGPDTRIDIPQPGSADELKDALRQLNDEISSLAILFPDSPHRGKTKHPGLGYFSAFDWLQFADMHFRHHLRQKKRIDDFLRAKNKHSH